MLVSFNWLKEYLDLSDISAEELAEKFTLGGLEVETIQDAGKDLEHLVVGKVLTVDSVEGSEHLKMTTVDVGTEELSIICGAPNCEVNQKVIVAKIGAILPGDFEIKETKIMGQTSQGMLCSLNELGFSDSVIPKEAEEGIFILSDDAEVGSDARPYIGLDDAVFEFDLTPNRADALSMRGVAHEVAAILDKELLFETVAIDNTLDENIEDYVSVSVEDKKDTSDYRMRIVKDVNFDESPMWMQRKLMSAGMRPIDLIVDVTNYVMLEYGQPLHAFDYDKLESKEIYVRRAEDNEAFRTLDGKDRELMHDNLVITNGEKPVALAGVMGGENSQITSDTRTIAIESAIFDPVLTRRTANKLNLRSEASNRFEKGINHSTVQEALDLATKLIAELGQGEVVAGTAQIEVDTVEQTIIDMTVEKVNHLIGTSLSVEEISAILTRLGLEHESSEDGQITTFVPARRWDLKIPEDLIEEIARIYGYNNIPITLPVTESVPGELTVEQKTTRLLRKLLEGSGLQEAISYSLTTAEKAERYAIEAGETVSLQNPASEERVTLRQSMVSGLLDNAAYNQAHNVEDIALYEIGRVFYKEDENSFLEENNVGGLLSHTSEKEWYGEEDAVDFYTIKGVVESLLDSFLFHEEVRYELNTTRDGMHPGRTADIYVGEQLIGFVGQIHPTNAKLNDLKDTFVFELSLDELLKLKQEKLEYAELSRYPGSSRDIALLVDREITHAELEHAIFNAGGKWLKHVHLFDLYEGDTIDKDKKSVAYSLYFQNPQQTLKEKDVKDDFERIKTELINKFQVEIR